jgi:CRP-like cAMP-binding protein
MYNGNVNDLKNLFLFQLLTANEIDFVAEIIKEKSIEAGEKIFAEFDTGDTMYMIESGRIKITAGQGNNEKELTVLKKGDFFGEIALFERVPRTAAAIAVEESNILEISRADFSVLISNNPHIGNKILFRMVQDLSKKLRNTIAGSR